MNVRILNSIKELNIFLTCPVCLSKCKNPVRIKVCGHYFCEECLKRSKSDHNCPKCKSYYRNLDLEQNNIARQTEKYLVELEAILFSEDSASITFEISEKNKTVESSSNDHIIFYENEKYHINFVDSLYTKLNAKGESPLHIACKRGKIDEVRSLLSREVDLNIKDNAGWAPLHEAVENQHLEVVEILLRHGALVNIPGIEYTTPLHKAVCKNNVDLVKLLLKYGADKNAVDYCGFKPSDCSKNEKIKQVLECYYDHINVIRQLFMSNKISIYCHSVDEEFKHKLLKCLHIKVEDVLDVKKKITHILIKKSHKPSFKILISLLEGLHFIPQEAVEDILQKKYFISIPDYIFIYNNHLNNGIRRAMMSSLLKLPKLFDGINFFIEGHNIPVTVLNLKVDKEYVTKLIKAGGGRILYRAPALRTCEENLNHSFYSKENTKTYRCCNYIIFEKDNPPDLKYNMEELQHKSSEWLINCIINYEIC